MYISLLRSKLLHFVLVVVFGFLFVRSYYLTMPRGYLDTDENQFDVYRSHGMTWTDIAEALNVSKSKLTNWREDVKYEDTTLEQIADDSLDSYVSKFACDHSNTGEALMKGYMVSSGYKVVFFFVFLHPFAWVLCASSTESMSFIAPAPVPNT